MYVQFTTVVNIKSIVVGLIVLPVILSASPAVKSPARGPVGQVHQALNLVDVEDAGAEQDQGADRAGGHGVQHHLEFGVAVIRFAGDAPGQAFFDQPVQDAAQPAVLRQLQEVVVQVVGAIAAGDEVLVGAIDADKLLLAGDAFQVILPGVAYAPVCGHAGQQHFSAQTDVPAAGTQQDDVDAFLHLPFVCVFVVEGETARIQGQRHLLLLPGL